VSLCLGLELIELCNFSCSFCSFFSTKCLARSGLKIASSSSFEKIKRSPFFSLVEVNLYPKFVNAHFYTAFVN
jgi:hypothetical protein